MTAGVQEKGDRGVCAAFCVCGDIPSADGNGWDALRFLNAGVKRCCGNALYEAIMAAACMPSEIHRAIGPEHDPEVDHRRRPQGDCHRVKVATNVGTLLPPLTTALNKSAGCHTR